MVLNMVKEVGAINKEEMPMLKGKKRTNEEIFKINTMTLASDYSSIGYVDDLQYYQGKESIFKAKQIAAKMPKEKGKELIEFVRESNQRIEEESNWGGARPGAGRPATGRKLQRIYTTDEEMIKIREYLEHLRR